MGTTFQEHLRRELQDPEFTKLYGAADAKAEFAMALALARQERGMTQKELAEKVGVTQAYIAKLEGGDANPTLGTVGTLMAVLGLRLKMEARPLLEEEDTTAAENRERKRRAA